MTIGYASIQSGIKRSWLTEAAIVLGASVMIALFAPIAIRLPFTPVPIATQPHVVLLLGALLGSKRGALAVFMYLFQGAIGLPVFTHGGCGLLYLAGPTGGYLFGYAIAAFVTGWIVENAARRTVGRVFCAMAVGNVTIYLFGMAWLSKFVGLPAAVTLGMLPFLIGDFLKLVIGVKLLKKWCFCNT